MTAPKTWGTAQEIANLRLPGIPSSKPGVLMRAKKELWPCRPNRGNGGGKQFPLILVLPEAPVSGMTSELLGELKSRLKLLKVQALEVQATIVRLEKILDEEGAA